MGLSIKFYKLEDDAKLEENSALLARKGHSCVQGNMGKEEMYYDM